MAGGTYFGLLDQEDQEEVLRTVATEAAARFRTYFETIKKATGLRHQAARRRLETYRSRLPDVWAQLQANFPEEHTRQMRDWRRQELASSRRPPEPEPIEAPYSTPEMAMPLRTSP